MPARASVAAKVQDRLLLPVQGQMSLVVISLRRDLLAQLAIDREKGKKKTRKNTLIAIAILLKIHWCLPRFQRRPTN